MSLINPTVTHLLETDKDIRPFSTFTVSLHCVFNDTSG